MTETFLVLYIISDPHVAMAKGLKVGDWACLDASHSLKWATHLVDQLERRGEIAKVQSILLDGCGQVEVDYGFDHQAVASQTLGERSLGGKTQIVREIAEERGVEILELKMPDA